ncbi:MAG: HAMP domain-containing sensor histidine kinase [Pseudomonadota bacterium]
MTGPRKHTTGALRWLGRNRHTVFFGVSFMLLAALVSWWAIYLRALEMDQHHYRYKELRLEARFFASLLGHMPNPPEDLESLRGAEHLRYARCEDSGDLTVAMRPFHPETCLAPSEETITTIEREHRSKSMMVLGEGALSLFLILVTGWMFFRMVAAEHRSRTELRDLWSRVSHELKTPITGVKALLQTLEAQELPREEVLPLLRLALEQVDRQERLTENLLMGQHLERDGTRLHPRPMELGIFLTEYIDGLSVSLAGRRLVSRLDLPRGGKVRADPNALRVILDNLVDNAVKYGGDEPEIRLEAEVDGSWTRIHVVDFGLGFDPGDAELVFAAYRRLADEVPSERRGTGMGLTIARGLARRLGGQLNASSDGPGLGARFTLSLETEET